MVDSGVTCWEIPFNSPVLGPYRIRVSGRLKHFINAFGEEVIVDNADKAIVEAAKKSGAVVNDYTAAPVYFGDHSNGAHEWLIEFEKEPGSLSLICRRTG